MSSNETRPVVASVASRSFSAAASTDDLCGLDLLVGQDGLARRRDVRERRLVATRGRVAEPGRGDRQQREKSDRTAAVRGGHHAGGRSEQHTGQARLWETPSRSGVLDAAPGPNAPRALLRHAGPAVPADGDAGSSVRTRLVHHPRPQELVWPMSSDASTDGLSCGSVPTSIGRSVIGAGGRPKLQRTNPEPVNPDAESVRP